MKYLKCWRERNINLKFCILRNYHSKVKERQCAGWWSQRSLASTVFGGNRPKDPPCSSLPSPSNLFPNHSLQNQPLRCLQSLGLANTIFCYYRSNMRFVRIIPRWWGPPSTSWSTCICRPPTPTSLWTSIFTKKMWVWRACAIFSASWPRRMAKLPNCLLKIQNQCWDRVPFQNVQKPSQDEWGKTQDAMEATLLMEKNPSHALLDLCGPHRPPPLCLPGESLLGGAGETHQEDGWPPDQPPQAGRSSGWVKGISLGSTIRKLWSLVDFEEPSGLWGAPLVSGLLHEALLCSH